MLVGVAFLAVLTATIASYFVKTDRREGTAGSESKPHSYLRSFHSVAYSYSLATLRDLRRLLQQQDARLTVEQIRALLAWNETSAEERQHLHAMLAEITPPSAP